MAVQTITYANKSYINQNSGIADTNKINDTDMNEIKSVVNNNALELSTCVDGLVYSSNETDTGKIWTDGKPIYRKVVSATNKRIASGETISHNISNLGEVVSMSGVLFDGTNNRIYPTVYMNGTSLEVLQCGVNATNIFFSGNLDWNASATRTHTFIIEYVKAS